MDFRYHPLIEGLRINEDGTEIYYKDVLLIPVENDKTRENPTLKVNFINKSHSVTKLICEAWNGLSEHRGQRASKINALSDTHYSNLEWKEGASNGVENFKQKLKSSDIDDINELLKNNKSVTEIANMYNVNYTTIWRISNKYVEKDK